MHTRNSQERHGGSQGRSRVIHGIRLCLVVAVCSVAGAWDAAAGHQGDVVTPGRIKRVAFGGSVSFSAHCTEETGAHTLQWDSPQWSLTLSSITQDANGSDGGISVSGSATMWSGCTQVWASCNSNQGLNGMLTVVGVDGVTSDTGPACVTCIGAGVTFTVTTDPTGNDDLVSWSGGGYPTTQTGGATFLTYFTTSGLHTATATCGTSSKSRTVTVVRVASVTVDKAVACVGDAVTFTAHPDPAGQPLNCIQWERRHRSDPGDPWDAWATAPSSGDRGLLTTSTPGHWEYRARNGNQDAWQSVGTAVLILQVESIAGLASLYCSHADCAATVTAVLTGGAALPAGYAVTWGGDAAFSGVSGLTATAKFAGHPGKDLHITASVGAQTTPAESGAFAVVDHAAVVGVTVVTYTFRPNALDPGDQGATMPDYPVSDITAYFGHPAHEWRCEVTTATNEIAQSSRLDGYPGDPPPVQEASAAAATADNWAKMVADLSSLCGSPPTEWYVLAAIDAHEKVHSDLWKASNDAVFMVFRAEVVSLSAPYVAGTCETAVQAAAAIEALPAYALAEYNYKSDGKDLWNDDCGHFPASNGVTALCAAAEHAVVDLVVAAIQAKAAANHW